MLREEKHICGKIQTALVVRRNEFLDDAGNALDMQGVERRFKFRKEGHEDYLSDVEQSNRREIDAVDTEALATEVLLKIPNEGGFMRGLFSIKV